VARAWRPTVGLPLSSNVRPHKNPPSPASSHGNHHACRRATRAGTKSPIESTRFVQTAPENRRNDDHERSLFQERKITESAASIRLVTRSSKKWKHEILEKVVAVLSKTEGPTAFGRTTVWQQSHSQGVEVVMAALTQGTKLVGTDVAHLLSTSNGCPCCSSNALFAKFTLLLGFRSSCAVSTQCGLTPRSSGAPTAGHQARAGGTLYIFTGPGLASCRRRPLSSNVRLHKQSVSACQYSNPHKCDRLAAFRAVLQTHPRFTRSLASVSKCIGTNLVTKQYERATRFSAIGTLSRAAKSIVTRLPNTVAALQRRQSLPTSLPTPSRKQAHVIDKRIARWQSHPLQPPTRLQPREPVKPNHSLKRSANGRPPSPGRWYFVHFHRPGLGVLPLPPA
jgi:hypothetical protein